MPLYHQLREILEDGILMGNLKPGEPLFSERKICRMFNISRPLVIRVFNEMTEKGLLYKKQGSGTFVSANALAILKKQNHGPARALTVGIGFLDYQRKEDPTTIKILNSVQRCCDDHGISTRLLGTAANNSKLNEVDGVLVIDETRDGEVFALDQTNIPFVTMFAQYEGKDYPIVMNDPVKIGEDCTDYFISKGHRRIAYIAGPLQRPQGYCLAFSPRMIEGYRNVLKNHKIRFSKKLIKSCDHYKESEAYSAALDLLDLPDPPTAIIAFDDILAMGAVRAIQGKGLKIPQDIAVMGSGDILDTDFLSTVERNIPKAAETALDMLMRIIHRQPLPTNTSIINTNLMLRQSTG